jgi:hypothetical protein
MPSPDAPTAGIAALGLLELGLAFRMSLLNVEQMRVARRAPGDPRAAAAAFLATTAYKSWSRAQLNTTEYAPMLGLLMLLVKHRADARRRALTTFEKVSCYGAVASSFAFAYALATQGRLDHRNLRPGRGGMSPLRPVAAMARYFFMGCLVVNAWRA